MYGVERGATNDERGGPNAAPAVVAMPFSGEERTATRIHAVRDGHAITLAPGHLQEGRVLSADDRNVTVLARGSMSNPISTVTYPRAELEAAASHRGRLDEALKPGNNVLIGVGPRDECAVQTLVPGQQIQ